MRRGCKPFFLISEKSLYETVKKLSENWFFNFNILNGEKTDIKKYAEQKNCEAVVTGYKTDNIKEIAQLTKQIKTPVLHPLIGLTEEEIKEKSKLIGL